MLTIDTLKNVYGFKILSDDVFWENILEASKSSVFRYIGLGDNGEISTTEYFDGDNKKIFLSYSPILQIVKVSSRTTGQLYSYYSDTRKGILTITDEITKGMDEVKVEYKAGYDLNNLPKTIEVCIVETARFLGRVSRQNLIGVNSRNVDGGSEGIDHNMLPLLIQHTLDLYKVKVGL